MAFYGNSYQASARARARARVSHATSASTATATAHHMVSRQPTNQGVRSPPGRAAHGIMHHAHTKGTATGHTLQTDSIRATATATYYIHTTHRRITGAHAQCDEQHHQPPPPTTTNNSNNNNQENNNKTTKTGLSEKTALPSLGLFFFRDTNGTVRNNNTLPSLGIFLCNTNGNVR